MASVEPQPRKLLGQVRDVLRFNHSSYQTEQPYGDSIQRLILFRDKRHPREMGSSEIEAFLTHLAVKERGAASTQNQAFSALLFLDRPGLQQELPTSLHALRA